VTWALLLALALVTVASRVLPMVLLPLPRGRLAEVLDGLPPPLFASLAVVALAGAGDTPAATAALVAGGSLVGATRRSLALTLVGGIAGFALGQALTS
jgi:branched-subunit amino acid transport protein